MSLSTRETAASSSSDDESYFDLWASTSEEVSSSHEEESSSHEEESSSHEEVEMFAKQIDASILPPEIWVLVSDFNLESYGLISCLSRMYYQAVNETWESHVHRDFTQYPVLRPDENYRSYYRRMAQEVGLRVDHKFGLYEFQSGEINFKADAESAKFDELINGLINAVKFDLEKFAINLIKIIPSTLNTDICKKLFKAVSMHSIRRRDIIALLLDLIKDFPEHDRCKLIVTGCKSFFKNSILKNNYHNGEVFSLLWKSLPVDQQRLFSFLKDDPEDSNEQEFLRLLSRAHSLILLGGVLTDIQCILDSYPDDKRNELVKDALLSAHFLGTYGSNRLKAKMPTAVSLLMNVLSVEERRSLAMQVINSATTFYNDGVVRMTETSNFTSMFKKYMQTLVNEGDPQRASAMILFPGDLFHDVKEDVAKLLVIAKTFYSVVIAFSIEELKEKILLLSFLSKESQKKVIEACVEFSVGGNVESSKVQYLLTLLPENDRVRILASLFWSALDETFVMPEEKLQKLYNISDNMRILMPVMKLFLQKRVAKDSLSEERLKRAQALFRQFPRFQWQQTMKEVVEEKLTSPDNNKEPSISKLLTEYESDSTMEKALEEILSEAVSTQDDKKSLMLLSAMPVGAFLQPVFVYLDKCIQSNKNTKTVFKNFKEVFAERQDEFSLLYGMADYDRLHQTSHLVRSFFLHYKYREDILVNVLRKTSHIKNLQAIVWEAINDDYKLDVLSKAIADRDLSGSGYNQVIEPLFKTFSKEHQDTILLKAIRRTAELPLDDVRIYLLSRFYVVRIGLSSTQFVKIFARALNWFLTDDWELHPAQNLLKSLSIREDTKKYVNLILLKAFHMAVLQRDSQIIVALLNLPVAWALVERSEMDELLTCLKEDSPLNEEDRNFLSDSISPPPRAAKFAPTLGVTSKRVGLFKPEPDKNLVFARESLALALRKVCVDYRAHLITKNPHDTLASLVIACLDKLPGYADRTTHSDLFQLEVLKIMLLSLIKNFEGRHSKKFMSLIDTLKRTHASFLMDLKDFEKKHESKIEFVVNIFKAHHDINNENIEADKILEKLALTLRGALFAQPRR